LVVTVGADRAAALTGDTLSFTVAFTNTTANAVLVSVTDALPASLGLIGVQHGCPSGTTLSTSHSFSATVTVASVSSCGLVVGAVVTEGCNCPVVNHVAWSAGGLDGSVDSPPLQLLLPTIDYPSARDALTDLNPIYVPFITTTLGWTPYSRTSYDRSAGNSDGFDACHPPEVTDDCCTVSTSTVCTWTIIPADVSGLLTRLQVGQAVVCPPFNSVVAEGRIELFSPPTAAEPAATLDLSRLITYTDYPLAVDGAHSSGGILLYKPFRFNQGLKIRSTGIGAPVYFELNYVETPPTTATVGWVTSPITSAWQAGSMGQTADRLSFGTPAFRGVRVQSSSLTLSPGGRVPVFEDAGAGTIVKMAFSQVERPGFPLTDLSLFAGIQLHVRYADDDASVDLPLDWLFLSPWADYTPDQPPTQDLDAMVFAPTGKHIIVASDTAWILEAPAYDIAFQQYGTASGVAPWYRVSLARLLQGTGALPPGSGLDTYSLHSLLGEGAAIVDQGEWVTRGPVFWSRGLTQTAWMSGTLQGAWGNDVNHPPTDRIDCQTYSFDTGRLPPTLTRYVIRGDDYWTTTITQSDTVPHVVTWRSGPLVELLPFYDGGGLDTFAVSRLGQIATSGSQFWFCPAGRNCRLEGSWSGPTPLSDAWWMGKWPNGNDKVYGQGSLFYGYDESRQEYYLTLPMPYRDGISVTLSNASSVNCLSCTVSLRVDVSYTPQEYGAGAGYLDIHAVEGNSGTYLPTWPNSVLAVTLRGRGKLVGLVQRARGPIDPNWGRTFLEGDEVLVVDSDQPLCQRVGNPPEYSCDCDNRDTYVECGTGLENFFNSGWFLLHGPYYLPTHGIPRTMPNFLPLPPLPPYSWGWPPNLTYPFKYMGEINRRAGPGYAETETRMYRFFLNDAVRFQRWLHLGVEFQINAADSRWSDSPGSQPDTGVTLGVVTIAYIAPGHVLPPTPADAGE
jgi:uncharacterized repeat protein (TIGR01451 family)